VAHHSSAALIGVAVGLLVEGAWGLGAALALVLL